MAPGEATRPAVNEELLSSTVSLAQTQLLGQIADETSLDGRTMGLLAFNGGLLAADIAAKDLLGAYWWTPLVPVFVATIIGAVSVASKEPDFGPPGQEFYTNYRSYLGGESREQLLSDLTDAFEGNAKRVKGKKSRLRWALFVLGVGLSVSALIIGLDQPTKLEGHAQTNRTTSPAVATRTRCASSCAVAAPARRTQRHSQVDPHR